MRRVTRALRPLVALTTLLALAGPSACDADEDDGASAFVTPGSTLVTKSGYYVSTFGSLRFWNVGGIAAQPDGRRIAAISISTTTTLTSATNPFDPSDPTNYGGSVSSGGAEVSVSVDGGATWAAFPLPSLAYFAHWHRGRLYLAFGFGDQSNWQYAIRELDVATGELGPALGAPFHGSYTLAFSGRYVSTYRSLSGHSVNYQLLDLDAGQMHESSLTLPADGCYLPHLRTQDGGYTWSGFARCDVVDPNDPSHVEPMFCQFSAMPLPTFEGDFTSVRIEPSSLCAPLLKWPGTDDREGRAIQVGIRWLWLFPRDGRMVGVRYAAGADPDRLDLGPGVLSPTLNRVDDDRWANRLWPLTTPDGATRWIQANWDDTLREVAAPQPTRCDAVDLDCPKREKLLALRPIAEPGTSGQEVDWLVFSEVDLGEDGAHDKYVYMRRERFATTPLSTPNVLVPDNGAPGCTEPIGSPTPIDNACATLVSCRTDGSPTTAMSACVTTWLRADDATRRELVAGPVTCSSPWVYGSPPIGGASAHTCPRVGKMCVGDALVHCGSDDGMGNIVSSYVTACGAAGLGCEPIETAPHEPADARCTGGRGCPLSDEDLAKGICQGDRIYFGVEGGARWVDCAALGLGTCRVGPHGNAWCVAGP